MAEYEGKIIVRQVPLCVLVVDDDPDIRTLLSSYFQREGIAVSLAASGREMLREISTSNYALIILDLRIGEEDGLTLLRRIRALTDVPVIIVTGDRREEHERVLALELGADDYMVKPFNLRELLTRIRRVLRRRRTENGTVGQGEMHISKFEGWCLDRQARRLFNPVGHHVPLSNGEYLTLLAFLDRPGRVVTRETLLAVTGLHVDRINRSVDIQVLRLRRKLEADTTTPCFIRTAHGAGYFFSAVVENLE